MEEFSPLLIMGILWLFIGLPIMKISQAAKKNAAKNPQNPPKKPVQQQAPKAQTMSQAAPDEERFGRLQPSISVTGHDDSIYQGSLNAVTGEGFDPCHEEQLASLNAEPLEEAPVSGTPGFRLNWSGDEIVKGLVMSEILKRK